MVNYWFTSDWHLSHENLRKEHRTFISIEEMNEKIIQNFYEDVKRGDYVYFLGDFSWDKEAARDFFKQMSKSIHFFYIYGNHDKKIMKKELLDRYCKWHGWIKDIKINEQKITLCHYMMTTWNCSHHGAWQLHGHSHSDVSNMYVGKQMNVCVDLHNYRMVNYDQVVEYMKTQKDNWNMDKEVLSEHENNRKDKK